MGFRSICTKLGYHVVAEAATGAEAIELVEEYQPDLLILDLLLRDQITGQDVQAELRQRNTRDGPRYCEYGRTADGPRHPCPNDRCSSGPCLNSGT